MTRDEGKGAPRLLRRSTHHLDYLRIASPPRASPDGGAHLAAQHVEGRLLGPRFPEVPPDRAPQAAGTAAVSQHRTGLVVTLRSLTHRLLHQGRQSLAAREENCGRSLPGALLRGVGECHAACTLVTRSLHN